ncbi:MAG: sulfite exporter TauE/SafE family protein [Clostridia bacterium]|nr:sulfite exporter TauE/SafE family protein [Clostridia bacterium]
MLNLKNGNKFFLVFLFALGSFVAGGINGFLGTGGGILLVFLLNFITNNDGKDTFANTLCATIPISLVGLFAYYNAGAIDFDISLSLSVPCMLGGLLGAFLVDRLKVKWLSIAFSLLIVYSGITMLVR